MESPIVNTHRDSLKILVNSNGRVLSFFNPLNGKYSPDV